MKGEVSSAGSLLFYNRLIAVLIDLRLAQPVDQRTDRHDAKPVVKYA